MSRGVRIAAAAAVPLLAVVVVGSLVAAIALRAGPAAPPPTSSLSSCHPSLPSAASPALSLPAPAMTDGEWTDLVDRPWSYASTGWQVLADTDLPLRDWSFTWEPMVVAGETLTRGISVYPLSEIVYDLNGSALAFRARIGVTDDSKKRAGSVRFYAYGDEFLLYESVVVRAGERAREVEVNVQGLAELRLVVDDGGDGPMGDYALWGEPLLALSLQGPSLEARAAIEQARGERAAAEAAVRSAERDALEREASRLAALGAGYAGAPQARGGFDSASSMLVLGNRRVLAALGFGGPDNGRLTVYEPSTGAVAVHRASPVLVAEDGRNHCLAEARPLRHEVRQVSDPLTGQGFEIEAGFAAADGSGTIVATVTTFDADPAVRVRLRTEGIRLRSVRYLDVADESITLGAPQANGPREGADVLRYLTDRSHLYWGRALADGHLRKAPLEATKPALVWSELSQRGLLFTLFDYVPSPAWLTFRRQAGKQSLGLGVELAATLGDFGPQANAPPALSIELIHGPMGAASFERYQRVAQGLYPARPWPAGLRFQWGSWYAYGPGVSAALMQQQIDRLAASFGDLGPWQVVVDAGWYVQYAREDAEMGNVDFEKFPHGVRGVADAAHARGMTVALYLGTGFIHDSPGNEGEWLALRGVIDSHPDWLIPFQHEASSVRRFLLDYANPEVRAYLSGIVRDFFLVHGVDGILIDGLADAEGQLIPRVERDGLSGPAYPLLPTLDIYRLIREEADRHHANAFIESGWLNPMAANPHAHVFFYGDEVALVDSPYPFGGFLQHLDYALFSRMALGQRSYVGASTGDPNLPEARWWLQAATALGAHATLGARLELMTPQTIAAFRADLQRLAPFEGETRYGPGLLPETFATIREGTTYLGVVNRAAGTRTVQVHLEPLGLDGGGYAALEAETGRSFRVESDFEVELPARSFRLFILR